MKILVTHSDEVTALRNKTKKKKKIKRMNDECKKSN